jgi:hypothetical protein
MAQDKEELKKQYEELYQKKAYHGWDEEKLQELIDNFDGEVEEPKAKKEQSEVKDPVMDFEIDQNKEYSFDLQRRKEARHNIPTTASVWCEATQSIRDIRYVKTEESPYVDEQEPTAKVEREQIKFNSKELIVSGHEKAKIRYLLAYDANGDKKKILPANNPIKNLYKLRDTTAADNAEIEYYKQVVKAGAIIEEAKIGDIRNFMRSRFGETSERDEEIIKIAYKKAQANPALFVTDFTNPKHKIKAAIQKAHEDQFLAVDGNQIKYVKSGTVIKDFDQSRHSYDEALARWVLGGDKEAKEFYSLLEGELK